MNDQFTRGGYEPALTLSSTGVIVQSQSSKKDKSISPNRFPRPCTTPGMYYATIPTSGGIFSRFNLYFSTSSTGITSTTFYTTGTPIGWSWNQIVSYNRGWGGCTGGTILFGLQIGNLTIGYSRNYHFSYEFDTQYCSLSVRWGWGVCQ